MSTSNSQLVEKFRKGKTSGQCHERRMFIEGRVLYSYGHHFPLAIRYGEGTKRKPYWFLVNGDRYSSTTSGHQAKCFNLGPQIPFSALQAAGLDQGLHRHWDSAIYHLRIVDKRDSTWVTTPAPTPEDPDKVRREHFLGAVVIAYKRTYYLSGIDNEGEQYRGGHYFLCKLPRAVKTVDEAYDCLMPDRVREWEADPTTGQFKRQGDIYLLPTGVETKALPKPTQKYEKVFDTTHVATEMRINGDVYIRGTLTHRPEDHRPPQHRRVTLGRQWHIVVRNLSVDSWNAQGYVD